METYELFIGWDKEPDSVLHPTGAAPRRRFVLRHICPLSLERIQETWIERRGANGYYTVIRYRVFMNIGSTRPLADIGTVTVSHPYGGSHLDAVVDSLNVQDAKVFLEKV